MHLDHVAGWLDCAAEVHDFSGTKARATDCEGSYGGFFPNWPHRAVELVVVLGRLAAGRRRN